MAQRFIDPLFSKVLRTLSAETRRYLEDNGLDNLGVFESLLGDPEVAVEDLASAPSDAPRLEALLKEANRAARSQRAEFAGRPMADLLRADRKRKMELALPKPPTELQRAVEAPPLWHTRRLPSKLGRASLLEGDSRARKKAEEDERLRWAGEVADLLLGLDTPTAQRAKRAPDPRVAAMRMCDRVRAATLRSYVRAWRPFWNWWTATGEEQLPRKSAGVPGSANKRTRWKVLSSAAAAVKHGKLTQPTLPRQSK